MLLAYRNGLAVDMMQLYTHEFRWGAYFTYPSMNLRATENVIRMCHAVRATEGRHFRRAILQKRGGNLFVMVYTYLPTGRQRIANLENGREYCLPPMIDDHLRLLLDQFPT